MPRQSMANEILIAPVATCMVPLSALNSSSGSHDSVLEIKKPPKASR